MLENNAYENISTCVTIIENSLDDLKTSIIESINSNFVNRFNILGIQRKCPNIVFSSETDNSSNSININYNVYDSSNENEIIRVLTLATIPYNYDETNIYLNYGKNENYPEVSMNETIYKYSVVICFTMTSTISGFTILNPSSLVSNDNGETFNIVYNNQNGVNVRSYSQEDDFVTYDKILYESYMNNDNTIDYNNLFIRNKLISNPNCYYELNYTDLIDNNTVKNLPYVINKFYDINEITESTEDVNSLSTYSICSMLKTTNVSYNITEYPILFPKSIVDTNNIIKGYLNYVFDMPTQLIDTGDSINNLYSGQLINLEDSQYLISDSNTVVQLDNLIITSSNKYTSYTGRYDSFNVMYPDNEGVKLFVTLISDPTTISSDEQLIKTPVSESVHSWYVLNKNTDTNKLNIEYSCVNAGNYDFLYKVCIPNNGVVDTTNQFSKREYLRLHRLCEVDEENFATIPKFNNNGYLTTYTTISSVLAPYDSVVPAEVIPMTISLKLIPIESPIIGGELSDFIVKPLSDAEPRDIELEIKPESVGSAIKYYIKYENTTLGEVLFNNIIHKDNTNISYGAEIRFYSSNQSSNDKIWYIIDNDYYTLSDLIYIYYKYIPDIYIEYYGYSNVYINKTNLVGYYVNTDTVVSYNVQDDPDYNPDDPKTQRPSYSLNYYFATGKFNTGYVNNENETIIMDAIIINDLKLYFAYDNSGEPGEWSLVSAVYDGNTGNYSIGPQYKWGYPRKDENGDYLIEDLQSSTLTQTVWYKIESPNFETIIGSGNITINDIPIVDGVDSTGRLILNMQANYMEENTGVIYGYAKPYGPTEDNRYELYSDSEFTESNKIIGNTYTVYKATNYPDLTLRWDATHNYFVEGEIEPTPNPDETT